MTSMRTLGSLTLFSLLILTPGEDDPPWGGFRGNNGVGIAESSGLPEALTEENILWRTEIPAGYSSPTVAGEHVLITSTQRSELMTLCLNSVTGEIQWKQVLEFDGKHPGMGSAAAPSPVTDGELVYTLFHSFGLVAYDFEGEEIWRKPLGPFKIPHGMTTSPVLHGDLLILQVDQNVDSYLVAYDKKTGAEKWKVARPGFIPSYATPAIYTPEKGPAQVIVSGSFQVASYSVADGEKLWWVDGSAYMTKAVPVVADGICYVSAYTVPTSEFGMPPLQATFANELVERDANEDGKIGRDEWEHPMLQQWWLAFDLDGDDSLDEKEWEYMASTETATGGLFAIDMSGKGDVTKTHVKWRYDARRGLPDAPTPLVVDGTLFMIKDGLLTALDTKSGEIVKQGRVGKSDQYYASPVSADGKIIIASLSGQLSVISAQAEWEVLSSHDLEEETWSTPAIADDLVFIRTQEALYCFF